MKKLGLALFGAALAACGSTSAQATIFTFDVVYWEGQGAPPSNPAAADTAHFQLDDTTGSRTPPASHYQSINFTTVGQFFGYQGDGLIYLYPTASYGGMDMMPYPADSGPDYANERELWGDAIVGDDLDSPIISTGIFYMGDYGDRSGTYRVTITQGGTASPAPEPASWAMMVGGFGIVGGALRRRKIATVRFA